MEKLSKEQIDNLPEWMPIPDYPDYDVNCRKGLVRNARTLIARKSSLGKHGYPQVGLIKDGKVHTKNVHRIIALAAFGHYNIPTEGLCVCHLDEERWDARISNLALGSHQENMSFEKAKQRNSEAKKGKRPSKESRMKMSEAKRNMSLETRKKMSDAQQKKRVGAYKDGVLTLIFNSVRLTNVYGFNASAVCNCCKGKQKSHKSLEWKYIK